LRYPDSRRSIRNSSSLERIDQGSFQIKRKSTIETRKKQRKSSKPDFAKKVIFGFWDAFPLLFVWMEILAF